MVYDNLKGLSSSNKRTIIKDQENNLIYLNNFEYQLRLNIFKSIGDIKVIDNMENSYEFSQIYIDEKRNNWIRRKNIFLIKKNLNLMKKINLEYFLMQ